LPTHAVLKEESLTAMRFLGVGRVSELGPNHVSFSQTNVKCHASLDCSAYLFSQINSRALEQQIYDGPAGLEKLSLWVQSKL